MEHAKVHGFLDKWNQTAAAFSEAFTAFRNNHTYFPNPYIRCKTNMRNDPFSIDKLLTNQRKRPAAYLVGGAKGMV